MRVDRKHEIVLKGRIKKKTYKFLLFDIKVFVNFSSSKRRFINNVLL